MNARRSFLQSVFGGLAAMIGFRPTKWFDGEIVDVQISGRVDAIRLDQPMTMVNYTATYDPDRGIVFDNTAG